jgi:hypothetical protein
MGKIKTGTLLLILFVLILILIGAIMLQQSKLVPAEEIVATESSPSPLPIQSTQTHLLQETRGTTTAYSSEQYGFTFVAPATLEMKPSFDSFYLVSNTWRQDSFSSRKSTEEATSSEQLATLVLRSLQGAGPEGDMYGYERRLNIGSSNDPAEVAHCFDEGEAGTSTIKTINGTDYQKFSIERAGMQKYAAITSYRTLRNDSCISIEDITHMSNYSFVPNPDTLRAEDAKIIDSILSTFTFNK